MITTIAKFRKVNEHLFHQYTPRREAPVATAMPKAGDTVDTYSAGTSTVEYVENGIVYCANGKTIDVAKLVQDKNDQTYWYSKAAAEFYGIRENHEHLQPQNEWSPEYCYSVTLYMANGDKIPEAWFNLQQAREIKRIYRNQDTTGLPQGWQVGSVEIFKSDDGVELEEAYIRENNNTATQLDIAPGLSDIDQPRPKRMKAPDSSHGHDFALFSSRHARMGGLYIQDDMSRMLYDKYGEERGEKLFQGLIGTPGGAFFAQGDKIAREKTTLINDLGLGSREAFTDYFHYSYFSLWKAWMEKNGFPYKIEEPVAATAPVATPEPTPAPVASVATAPTNAAAANVKADKKDVERIQSLVNKNNPLQFAQTMAKSITDKNKALRRGKAAEDMNHHDIAEVFYKRAAQL